MQQKGNLVDIQLSEESLLEMVRLLDFAALASNVALSSNSTPPEDIKILMRNIENARQLGDMLIVSLDIGNPKSDSIN